MPIDDNHCQSFLNGPLEFKEVYFYVLYSTLYMIPCNKFPPNFWSESHSIHHPKKFLKVTLHVRKKIRNSDQSKLNTEKKSGECEDGRRV